MGRNVERFGKICKEKGILAGLAKAISYLVFVVRRRGLERTWKGACLRSGRLEIRGWDAGPRLYWDGTEITKTAGLNTSVFVNGKWYDSSKAKWKMAGVRPGSLILKNSWRSLPIGQTWIVSDIGNGRILCEIKLETPKDIEFIEQKFTFVVSERFNLWSDASSKAIRFPGFKDEWTDIKEVKKQSDFISAQSDVDKDMPEVILKKSDSNPAVYLQIQNSDFKTEARLLNFVVSSKDMDLKYKKGTSAFFKTEITVK